MSERYQGERVASPARRRLDSELELIDELGLAGFFLLHHEVLEIARECAREVRGTDSPRAFLPPGRGRGSSVGSIVCYLTGLSHVDPVSNELSLGRFLNRELASVPDIDLDFPRDIREKLIVRVTERYGREHAALVASFATYRSRGAIRDVGKALGLPFAELERLARTSDGWSAKRVGEEVARLPDGERKLESKRWRAFAWLTGEISGLPRHVSQHPGGMIVSTRPLIELVPVQPAAMAGRQLCQWDKDSCSDAGFLKIDLLGLGMLSAVEDCVEQIARTHDEVIDLSRIPFDDETVYDDIQRADTIGTFQIESRAQMQSLLRTKPANLDDITVQVALVRPGPIQGKAVHPYIDARQRLREDPSYVFPVDHELLREPLRSTFGVVVFQDQVLEVAIALAGFTVGEAEGLRRAMSRKRSHDALEAFRERFSEGAADKGVDVETADTVFDKLVGFSGFGFPKAHAAAFGLLAYQSTWLRHYYPAEFLCALLNEQPMGFYPPATLVRDAQRHGVEVLPVDVNLSGARCVVEWEAVRIGLSYISAIGKDEAETLVSERDANGPYRDVADLARRSRLSQDGLEALVKGGACDGFWKPRRDLLWELGLVFRAQSVPGTDGEMKQLPLELEPTTATPALRDLTRWERMLADYRHTSMSIETHPLTLLRAHLPPGTLSSTELLAERHGRQVVIRGHDGRAPAAVHGERDRLHAARGRARPGEPRRPFADLRAAPRDGARRAADPRPGPLRARGGEPQRPRLEPRVARPARAHGGEGRHGLGVASAPALLRPPLTRPRALVRARHVDVESVNAVSTIPMWVNACGKLPTSRPRSGSYSSEMRPRSLRSPSNRSYSSTRLVAATLLVEDGGEPERARQEGSLARWQPVDSGVLVVGAVALDEPAAHELGLDRANRADDALVGRGEESDERDQEAARVEAIRAEELRECTAVGIEPLAQHLVLDLLPYGLPAVDRPVATVAFDRLDGTVERDPGHDLRVREVPPRPAHFPDPLVGLAPAGLEPVEDLAGQAPRRVGRLEALVARLVQSVDDLAVDVELPLIGCAVADPNGLRPFVPAEPGQLELREPSLTGDAVHDLQILRRAGDRAEEPVAPIARPPPHIHPV